VSVQLEVVETPVPSSLLVPLANEITELLDPPAAGKL